MRSRIYACLTLAALLCLPGMALGQKKPPAKKPATPAAKPAPKPKPAPPAARPKPAAETPAPRAVIETPALNTKAWALLVGVGKYQNPQVSSLRYPSIDAAGIRDALIDPKLGALPPGNVRLLTDEQATAANILGAVDDFLMPNVQPGDQVILFLAGHGVAKGIGPDAKSFLLPTDVKGLTTASLESSAVNLRALSEKLGKLPASQFVVFVDACREDPTPGRGIKGNTLTDVLSRGIQIVPEDAARTPSVASFFACSIGQRAFEDPSLNHGVFTYWILEGIRAAAIPKKPDGAIDMGILQTYVTAQVQDWARKTSAKGDFEVEQTPDFSVSSETAGPIVLMHVKRPLPETPLTPEPPTLTLVTNPEGATVTVNGERLGAAPLTKTMPQGGSFTVKVEAPGYAPLERAVTLIDGYGLLMNVSLQPGARGAAVGLDARGPEMYLRAQEAEQREQWEAAEGGYDAVLKADPLFVPAYERLADLRLRRGKDAEAVTTLIAMVNQAADTAHGYSLLSRAYSALSARGTAVTGGAAEKEKPKSGGGLLGGLGGLFGKKKSEEPKGFTVPRDAGEAATLARRAADEAVKRDPNSAEAQRALGFALVAADQGGKNQKDALNAFGKAVLLDTKDAANHYGMGYGLRAFAVKIKDEKKRKPELERAVAALKEALALRPDYYEAHREIAFCYHALDDAPRARAHYEAAKARPGAASDENEMAAVNLSLAGIHRQEAKNASGERQQGLLLASDGYYADAKDLAPNLEVAIRILNRVGVSTRVADYLPLPAGLKALVNGDVQSAIEGQLRNSIRLPF